MTGHTLLVHGADSWKLEGPEGPVSVKVDSPIRTNSSEVIREAVLSGAGIALRSTWDIGRELSEGKLREVLPAYHATSRVAVHAVYPSRRHLAHNVRVFIDFLAALYGPVPYWDRGRRDTADEKAAIATA